MLKELIFLVNFVFSFKIALVSNKGTTGIGCFEEVSIEAAPPTEKQNIWKKTQERFQKLPETNETFQENSNE